MPNLEIRLTRFSSDTDSTLGMLHNVTGKPQFLCYTLEDEHRTVKVWGETRIPAGRYKLKIRQYGGFHERYQKKYNAFHKGMIEICDVPNFEHILIHVGNTDDDTAGCVLLGNAQRQNITKLGLLYDSVEAYERVYRFIVGSMLNGCDAYITIIDMA